MSKPLLALPLFIALVACGTPQEQCIARETRDLRVVNRLIAESEGNLQRGYAFEDVVISHSVWVLCGPIVAPPPPVEGAPSPAPVSPRMCLDERDQTITRPVAIDLVAERAKLSGLKEKRSQLTKAAERSTAACRNAYPE